MSVDIQWDSLTAGPDGARLAETIRAFVHDKFQQVTLPRFIRSVYVHSFDFGSVAPELELKDICDPLPDFYDEPSDDVSAGDAETPSKDDRQATAEAAAPQAVRSATGNASNAQLYPSPPSGRGLPCDDDRMTRNRRSQYGVEARQAGWPNALSLADYRHQAMSPAVPSLQSPGIPGGTSNLTYFHSPLGAGISGTPTPLAAVAGAHFHNTHFHENATNASRKTLSTTPHQLSTSVSSLTPPSSADPSSRPPSQHYHESTRSSSAVGPEEPTVEKDLLSFTQQEVPRHEQSPEDIQIVAHVRYAGDLKLSLTAEILLDYPMPSFVGIPLQLNITGLVFDGVAVLAYIKKRAHFCFVSPEDAEALVGRQSDLDSSAELPLPSQHPKMGDLLEQIRVESEIGDKQNGKQVLKNVGKVEKFVLEQVRRIFEDELVYPSFWTFLV